MIHFHLDNPLIFIVKLQIISNTLDSLSPTHMCIVYGGGRVYGGERICGNTVAQFSHVTTYTAYHIPKSI